MGIPRCFICFVRGHALHFPQNQNRLHHHIHFEYEYEYRCTEYEYDFPGRITVSHNQHGIPVAVEAITVFNGLLIGFHDQLVSGQGSNQHNQS